MLQLTNSPEWLLSKIQREAEPCITISIEIPEDLANDLTAYLESHAEDLDHFVAESIRYCLDLRQTPNQDHQSN